MKISSRLSSSALELNYFSPFAVFEYLREETGCSSVVLYDRESITQHRNGEAEARRIVVQEIIEDKGFKVVAYVNEIGSGKSCSLHNRSEFHKAVEIAKKFCVPIVAPSVDRIIRPCEYNKRNQLAPLMDSDLACLDNYIDDVFIMTVIPPGLFLVEVQEIFEAWDRRGKAMLTKVR